jgi:hypothetical protein
MFNVHFEMSSQVKQTLSRLYLRLEIFGETARQLYLGMELLSNSMVTPPSVLGHEGDYSAGFRERCRRSRKYGAG